MKNRGQNSSLSNGMTIFDLCYSMTRHNIFGPEVNNLQEYTTFSQGMCGDQGKEFHMVTKYLSQSPGLIKYSISSINCVHVEL